MWTKWCLKDSLTSLFCSTKALNSSMRSLCVAIARPCHDGAIVAACAAAACAATVAAAVTLLLVGAPAPADTTGDATEVLSAAAAVRLKGLWLKGLTLKEISIVYYNRLNRRLYAMVGYNWGKYTFAATVRYISGPHIVVP